MQNKTGFSMSEYENKKMRYDYQKDKYQHEIKRKFTKFNILHIQIMLGTKYCCWIQF